MSCPKRRRTEERKEQKSEGEPAASGESESESTSDHGNEQVAFSWDDLSAEIEDVRKNPPDYVSRVGYLQQPRRILKGGALVEAPCNGPWDFTVAVRGSQANEAYNYPFLVAMRFEADKWPRKTPLVRFQGVFHHALVSDLDEMAMPFYRAVQRASNGMYTCRLLLQAIHEFLENPLKQWKIPEDSLPPKLSLSIKAHEVLSLQRLETIGKYAALVKHPALFQHPVRWEQEWFEPAFWHAHQVNTPEIWRSILTEHLKDEVFSFKLFTDAFCEILLEEIFNFYASGLPVRRPNSMNNYGIILNDIGLEPLIDELQRMFQPLGRLLWPGPGSDWDGHHCFIVRYREGEDLGLDMHTDDSDVTFNICLGLNFEGAGLQFCGLMGASNHRKHTYTYKHVKGSCVCHLGRKRHGADDISRGERLNLILWNHSSSYRQSDEHETPTFEKEDGPPDIVCVSYTHDRDYGNFKEYPKGRETHRGKGWCPPQPYVYDGFKPDCDKEIRDS